MLRRVYFSVADRQMENFLVEGAFEKSLYINTFFQLGELIPDIFCYISGELPAHIGQARERGHRVSFFEACVEKEIVVPSFRSRDCSSFPQALQIILKQGIQGVRADADETARYLQLAADRNPNFLPYVPETHLGETYDQVLERYLGRRAAPVVVEGSGIRQEALEGLWRDTEHWRIGCIDQAREKAMELGEPGLRRGEIMNAVGRDLGILGPNDRVDDIGDLINHPLVPEEKKRALRSFFQWMCELYEYNHAIQLKAAPNFPHYSPYSGAVVNNALPAGPPLMDLSSIHVIRESVSFPRIKVLEATPPDELLAVRQEFNRTYLDAVLAWRREPNAPNESEVRRVLRSYSEALAKRCRVEAQSLVDITLGALPQLTREVLKGALYGGTGLMGLLGGTVGAWIPFFVVLGDELCAVYRAVSTRPEKIEVEIPRAVEVNFPAESEQKKDPNQGGGVPS